MMNVLLWVEKHVGWLRWDSSHLLHAEAAELLSLEAQSVRGLPRDATQPTRSGRTPRMILLNIGTSVGGAVLIGLASGVWASQRTAQQTADLLNDHERRITLLSNRCARQETLDARTSAFQNDVANLNRRLDEESTQRQTLETELTQWLIGKATR